MSNFSLVSPFNVNLGKFCIGCPIKAKKEHKISQVAQVAQLLNNVAQLNAKSVFLAQKRNLPLLVAQQVAQTNIFKKKHTHTFTLLRLSIRLRNLRNLP